MPLLDLQKSLRLLGKIRMGETRKAANGKSFPAKLANWRITSPSHELLEAAALIYGGDVGEWEGAPTEGKQYELYTTTDRLQVVVPPDNALIQSYEMWSAGGCVRRCDGVSEELSGQKCMCPADADERAKLAGRGNACKITTRLKVLLPDIPDIGVWMCESHGYYAAVELAGFQEIMTMATARGAMIPAQLRIDQRTAKRNGETRRYAVPVLELVSVTAHQLARGEVAALGTSTPALGAGAAALDAPRVAPRTTSPAAPAAGGPLLPHEITDTSVSDGGEASVGESPPSPADATQPNRVAIVAREAGLDDDGRHDLAEWASDSRMRSSVLLDESERGFAIDAAMKIKAGSHRLVRGEDGSLKLLDSLGLLVDRVPTAGTAALPSISPEQLAAMKGPEIVDALKARGLPVGGKAEEIRDRLREAIAAEPF